MSRSDFSFPLSSMKDFFGLIQNSTGQSFLLADTLQEIDVSFRQRETQRNQIVRACVCVCVC